MNCKHSKWNYWSFLSIKWPTNLLPWIPLPPLMVTFANDETQREHHPILFFNGVFSHA